MRSARNGRRGSRAFAAWACVATVVGALSACGNADKPAASAKGPKGHGPASLVPADVRASGKIVVGTNIPFKPMEYFGADGKSFTGADIDLIRAIAKGLGLKAEIKNMAYDGLIPAVASSRLNVLMSGTGDFTDRQKKIDFVDYLNASVRVVMTKQYASAQSDLVLCGLTMAVQAGTVQVTAAKQGSKRCTAAGKPAIKIKTFPEDAQAALALKSGRVQAHSTDGPIAALEAKSIGGVAKFPDFLKTPILYGIGIDKTKPGLTRAIAAQLNVLIKNGTYKQILRRYDLQDLALSNATVNGAKVSSSAIS